jgi:hydrogenase nickel incorporation protein HypB
VIATSSRPKETSVCTTCGCGSDGVRFDGKAKVASDATIAGGSIRYRVAKGARPVTIADALVDAHEPVGRIVRVEADILAKNGAYAAVNRRRFEAAGVLALNMMSSPGAGKTSLLVRTIERWGKRAPIAVIEGDQQTSRDADRVRATGAPAVQINTGKGCHLDAHMVALALDEVALRDASVLFIENVGNLVCPAAFDLGEGRRIVILSVTEGDDKPLKYPDMFRAADLVLVNKVDLLPHVDFDVATALGYARRLKPDVEALLVSARTGEGFDAWLAWLDRALAGARERAAPAQAPTAQAM